MADRPGVAHVAHDELLIASWVSGDIEPADAARAADLVNRCEACRELAADLRSLRAAVRALPAPARRRDFRLTPADAERLRSRPRWRDRFGGVRAMTFTRPLAGAMTALGLAGLMLTAVPLGGAGVGGEDRETARLETVGRSSSGGAGGNQDDGAGRVLSAPPTEAAAPAASAAASGAAGEQPLPVGASEGQELAGSPQPGDVGAAPGAGGGDTGVELHATPPAVAQATAPTASAQGEADAQTLADPVTSSDLARPALGVASGALLAGGLLLLFVTRRRGVRPH